MTTVDCTHPAACRRRLRSMTPWWLLSAPLVLLGLFFVAPLLTLFLIGFQHNSLFHVGGWTLSNYGTIFHTGNYRQIAMTTNVRQNANTCRASGLIPCFVGSGCCGVPNPPLRETASAPGVSRSSARRSRTPANTSTPDAACRAETASRHRPSRSSAAFSTSSVHCRSVR